jgi:hypothetical protein
MSFFDAFFSGQNSSTDKEVVILAAGTEEVIIPASEAEGKTVQQLFQEHSEQLGIDEERVNRFVDAGRIIDGTATVQSGHKYSGSTNSDTKG